MPIRSLQVKTQYITTGNPDTVNDATPYFTAQPGHVLPHDKGKYQFVQCDSGATASNAVGVPAAAQLAFWKVGQKGNYIVTNDLRLSEGGRNGVAGIFRNAVTPGNYCYIMQKANGVAVKGTSGSVLDNLIANSGTAADTTSVAAGTQLTYASIGTVTVTTAGGNMTADIDIPSAE